MKKLVFLLFLGLLVVLNVGYYTELEEAETHTRWFIKQSPTLRLEFFNIHANDGDYRRVEKLTPEHRQMIIDYCKYRLGIDTQVTTQADVERCAKLCPLPSSTPTPGLWYSSHGNRASPRLGSLQLSCPRGALRPSLVQGCYGGRLPCVPGLIGGVRR